MIKKALFLFISTVICFCSVNFVYTQEYKVLNNSSGAMIIEVIDGESIKVQPVGTNDYALVKFIGVQAWNNDATLEYLNSLLGKVAQLSFDQSFPQTIERFNAMYVYVDGSLVNSVLIERGLGKVDSYFEGCQMYSLLKSNEMNAYHNRLGIWTEEWGTMSYAYPYYDYGYSYPSYSYPSYSYPYYPTPTPYYGQPVSSGQYININTATTSFLSSRLRGFSTVLARDTVDYRAQNPFNTIGEIKFVVGLTPEIFTSNVGIMTVCTNINKASETELLSLGLSQSKVTEILKDRSRNTFKNIEDIYSRSLVSKSEYDSIKDFISVTDKSTVNAVFPKTKVNINKASHSQLTSTDLTSSQALSIISARKKGYSFKHIGELEFISSLNFEKEDIDKLEDNLTTLTDINTATADELRSLLETSANNADINKITSNQPFKSLSEVEKLITKESYEKLKPYIYIDNPTTDYINLNCATKEQLRSAGLSDNAAGSIYSKRQQMDKPSDIPVDVTNVDMRVTLYTNINTASRTELGSLSTNMTPTLIDEIVAYRMRQPFGTVSEVEELFRRTNRLNIYNDFRDFIIVR